MATDPVRNTTDTPSMGTITLHADGSASGKIRLPEWLCDELLAEVRAEGRAMPVPDSTDAEIRADAPVVGYMCLVDYEFHLGADMKGATIYPNVKDLRAKRKCVESCGIVEVETRMRRIVQEPTRD